MKAARSILTTLVTGPALIFTAASSADVTIANYVNDNAFNYQITHMPDLDQRRQGLDNNGGCHCVPAAVMNLLAYAANHGFGEIPPSPHYWQSNQNHILGTTVIDIMGTMMDTTWDPLQNPDVCGTDGADANAALANWLNPYDSLLINDHLADGTFSVNFVNAAKALINGNIGTASYGRYEVQGFSNGVPILKRGSGHATTAVRCFRNGGLMTLGVRDPADNNDSITEQSLFTTRNIDVTPLQVIIVDSNNNVTGNGWMSALDYPSGDGKIRLLDGFRTLRPAEGYSFSSSLSVFQLFQPGGFTLGQNLDPHPTPTGTGVLAAEMHPQHADFILVCAGSEVGPQTAHRFNPLNSESLPIALPGAPLSMAIGRKGAVYFSYAPAVGPIQCARLILPTEWSDPVANPMIVTLPFQGADAMTYDDATDRVAIFASGPRRLMLFGEDFASAVESYVVPSAVPLGANLDMALDPTTGKYWVCSDASDTLFGFALGSGGTLTLTNFSHASIVNPQSVSFDDKGILYVSSNGVVHEFLPDTAGGFTPRAKAFFDGVASPGKFRVGRSRTNFDPALHAVPEWSQNIPLDELVNLGTPVGDCLADIAPEQANNGVVDVDDLLAVINNWGGCKDPDGCVADMSPVGGNGVIDVDDLLLVINSWGSCN
jgi:hypothetical protein